MTLAVDLAQKGIRSILVERNRTTTAHPKMDITNSRSMELFRRLGLADMAVLGPALLPAVGWPKGRWVVLLDDADRIGEGSRAICFSKRSLEFWDRLGIGQRMVDIVIEVAGGGFH